MASHYIVSDDPEQIEPVGEDFPTAYATPEDAGDAIRNGDHGDYGTRYVLKISTEMIAEYSRPWTITRKAGS